MISVQFDLDRSFARQMNNLISYSFGFIDGANAGKHLFFHTIGSKLTEMVKLFIDSMARQDPESLHHVYEWYQTGSPSARLFDIEYTVSNLGLSLKSTFRQSTSIKNGSRVPFYNKASMMEAGMSVIIKPKNSDVLVFEDNGKTVFTRNAVMVDSVGGTATNGAFAQVFDSVFNTYFAQSFLQTVGINKRFGNLVTYKKNLQAGLKVGRAPGVAAGYRWIANLGVGL